MTSDYVKNIFFFTARDIIIIWLINYFLPKNSFSPLKI